MGNYSDPNFLRQHEKEIAKEKAMENQHRIIKGYRDLSQEEIDLINEIKAKEREILSLCRRVVRNAEEIQARTEADSALVWKAEPYRWAAIAQADLEKGFMALVRAVAMPVNKE